MPERGDEPLRDAYCGRSSFAPRGAGRHAVVVVLEARRVRGRRAAAEGSKRRDRAATDVPARRVNRRGAQPLNHNTYLGPPVRKQRDPPLHDARRVAEDVARVAQIE